MLAYFCFVPNFLELPLSNTFRYHLLKRPNSQVQIEPNCALLSACFPGNELALFPGCSGGKKRAGEL